MECVVRMVEDVTGWGLCPVAGFGINDVDPSVLFPQSGS